MFWQKFFLKLDAAKPDGGDGGGKGGAGNPPPDDQKKVADELRSMNQKLLDRIEALEKGTKAKPDGGSEGDKGDLADKARKDREASEAKAAEGKQMESALKFTMGSKDWLKTNASLLPKTIEGIFEQANKETYDSEVAKANEIKSGIIQEFFAQKANLDLLTDRQKASIEDFRKLAKNVKQEQASKFYDDIFEPTFESLKKIRKAEQVGRGYADPSSADDAYKQKIYQGSRKHYLGEKQ